MKNIVIKKIPPHCDSEIDTGGFYLEENEQCIQKIEGNSHDAIFLFLKAFEMAETSQHEYVIYIDQNRFAHSFLITEKEQYLNSLINFIEMGKLPEENTHSGTIIKMS